MVGRRELFLSVRRWSRNCFLHIRNPDEIMRPRPAVGARKTGIRVAGSAAKDGAHHHSPLARIEESYSPYLSYQPAQQLPLGELEDPGWLRRLQPLVRKNLKIPDILYFLHNPLPMRIYQLQGHSPLLVNKRDATTAQGRRRRRHAGSPLLFLKIWTTAGMQ